MKIAVELDAFTWHAILDELASYSVVYARYNDINHDPARCNQLWLAIANQLSDIPIRFAEPPPPPADRDTLGEIKILPADKTRWGKFKKLWQGR